MNKLLICFLLFLTTFQVSCGDKVNYLVGPTQKAMPRPPKAPRPPTLLGSCFRKSMDYDDCEESYSEVSNPNAEGSNDLPDHYFEGIREEVKEECTTTGGRTGSRLGIFKETEKCPARGAFGFCKWGGVGFLQVITFYPSNLGTEQFAKDRCEEGIFSTVRPSIP